MVQLDFGNRPCPSELAKLQNVQRLSPTQKREQMLQMSQAWSNLLDQNSPTATRRIRLD